MEDEERLLRSGGHDVEVWSPGYEGKRGTPRAAARAVWSNRARTELAERISSGRPDVVHVHNVFPALSPVVLRSGLPTVMTLHNFRLACLPATFLRNGQICEDCLGHGTWRGVMHGCYRGSRTASAAIAVSLELHRYLRSFDRVTLFCAVSAFLRDKLVLGGLDPSRARVRHNFAWPAGVRKGPGGYFLALGRLSKEKGLDTIIAPWRSRHGLLVVGDGPEREPLRAMASRGVEFRGAVSGDDVPDLIAGARALLVPSRWYEGSPRVVVEALAAGVPVVASRIGGLPEHVEDHVSGLLVDPADPDAWSTAVAELADDALCERLGDGARRSWHKGFSPRVALASLEAIYDEAVARAHGAGENATG